LSSLADGFVILDREWRYIYVNTAAARMLGKTTEELLGHLVWEALPESARLPGFGCFCKAIEENVALQFEQYSPGRGWFEYRCQPTSDGLAVYFADITDRKRAEHAQATLAAIVQNSPDAISTETVDGIITNWNMGAEMVFGYIAEEVIGRHSSLLVPPEMADELTENLDRVKHGEAVRRREVQRVRKDGSRIFISLSLSPIRDRDGQVVGIAKVARDVTERVQAEEALRRSENIYRAMARSIAGGAMSVVDRDLRYMIVEGALLDRLRLKREEMLGRTVEEVFEGEIGRQRAEYFRRAFTGTITSYETEYRGRIVWSQFVPLRDLDGQVMAAMSLGMDVTERKQAEEAVAKKSERLRLLSEAAADLLSGKAPETTVREFFGKLAAHLDVEVYFNYQMDESGKWLRLDSCAGVSEEEARSVAWLEFGETVCGTVAERRQPMVFCDVQRSQEPCAEFIKSIGLGAYACFPLLAGERLVGTLSFGSRRREEFSPEEVELLQTVSYYLAVAQEQAWQRRYLERTVEERTTALRDMIAELEQMSYSMVHSMRAPLRAIEGFASLIRRREGESLHRESRELLAKLQASVGQMDRLITDVLNYKNAVSRRPTIEIVQVDRLVQELQEAHPEFRPPRARVQLEGEFRPVLANAVALLQCLAELLRNGVKFVPPGTLPVIKVSSEYIEIPLRRVRLWFEDNGVGIPKEAQRRIFNLFERVHGPESPGTGVGLALVRKLVERMAGQVGVQSEPGQGSRFWIDLPAADSQSSSGME
jgi:PAS domain S-box-containing protein